MFTQRERSQDLCGEWRFLPDPMKRALRQQWWQKERDPFHVFPCWDLEGLWTTPVPSAWTCAHPELKYYEGHALYVRDFAVPEIPDGYEAYLCFDGAVYRTEAWLNGQWIGKHECGYSPFQFRVTPYLRGQNRLMVSVENRREEGRIPGEIFDWWNDGGLIRPVKLILVPERHVHNFAVRTSLQADQVWVEVLVWAESHDRDTPLPVQVAFPELGLEGLCSPRPGAADRVTFSLPRDQVDLWSPDRPRLYALELRTEAETLRDEVGLREVRTAGREILLNGEPIKLWGLCVHSEFKHMGRADTPELLDEFFARMHDLGVNFLRCAHYPYSDAFLRRADREGFLVWEEVPSYWQPHLHEPETKKLAFQMLRETLARDHNRACVIIWSVSNESESWLPETDGGNWRYGVEAASLLRALDPTRLISCAEAYVIMSQNAWKPTQGDEFEYAGADKRAWRPSLPEEFWAAMDVLAMNNYVGAYGQDQPVEDLADALRVWFPYNKPVIVSEFGSMSKRGEEREDLSVPGERRHVDVVTRAYRVLEQESWVAGASLWCFCDYRTPLHWQWYAEGKVLGRYGIVDEDWQPKQVYSVVRDFCRRMLGKQP